MGNVGIKFASVATRFQMSHGVNEDGPTNRLHAVVFVKTEDGREFYLPNTSYVADEEYGYCYVDRYEAEQMRDRVRARGVIDTRHWIEVENPTTEDRAAEAWAIEAEDRRAHGLYA